MKKLSFLLILSIGPLIFNSYAGIKPDKEVQKAFELRMNGKVDDTNRFLKAFLPKIRQMRWLITKWPDSSSICLSEEEK